MCKGSQVSALWQKPGSAAEGTFGRRTSLGGSFRLPKPAPERGLSSLEGSFGRRKCRQTCMSFVSVWEFRPPKVPPNLPDFRLWRDFRPPNLPPKVPCPAISCMFSCDVSGYFRGFLGSILESCSCMFGPSFESTCVGSDPRNRDPQQ